MKRHWALQLEPLESRNMFSATITGLHHEQIKIANPSGVYDLTGGVFPALEDTKYPIGSTLPTSFPNYAKHQSGESSNGELYPISFTGVSNNISVQGGFVQGQMDPRTPWHVWKGLGDGTGLRFEGTGTTEVSNMRFDNLEDGIDPRGPFNIHDVYMTRVHDDLIENDAVKSGIIANSYLRGHTFLSARGEQNPNAIVQVRNVVVELTPQAFAGGSSASDMNTRGGYPYPDGLGVGSIFKYEWGSDISGKVDISDSVFLVPRNGGSSNKSMQFAPGTYKNVTVVWLGEGDYPWAPPPGVTITRDRSIFDRAVDAFFASHPQFTRDDAPADPPATVVGRNLFYNASIFDGNSAGVSAQDDAAIARDKTALLPNQVASFANISAYSKGINGVMIDLAGKHGTITAGDFVFKTGNDEPLGFWTTAASPVTVSVRAGAGANGSDRVEIIWANNAIDKTWLQVTLKANGNTRLARDDVFYFGNAVGDSGMGDVRAAVTNATDELAARSVFGRSAAVDNRFDFNRDGIVNATDTILARSHSTIMANALRFLDLRVDVLPLVSASPVQMSPVDEVLADLVDVVVADDPLFPRRFRALG